MNDLPTGWRWVTPDEVTGGRRSDLVIGPFGSNLKVSDYQDSGIPLIFVRNIRSRDFKGAATRFISEQKAQELQAHEARSGDVLITKMGDPPGDSCIYTGGTTAIITADCIRLRPTDDFHPRFISLAFESPIVRSQILQITRGVAQKKVSLARFRSGITIPIPSLPEQERIVEILDDHLSRLDAALKLLSIVATRLRPLVSALLQQIVPVSEVTGWRLATVGEAGQIQLGRQRHPDWHTGPKMKPYLRVANVFEDRIDTRDVMQMDFSGVFERYRLTSGDVLLNEGQSPEFLGRPAIYRGDPPEVAFTNSLIRFKANNDVLPEWALLVFRRHMHAGRFMAESRITTNIAHLSASRLKTVEFPVPPLEQQLALVALANARLSAIERLQVELARRRKQERVLRRSLLDAAFSGRLTCNLENHLVIEELAGV